MKRRTVVLVILDGWGIGRSDYSNPIHLAQPQNIAAIKERYPTGSLQASGIAVGLPWNEEGNSEVGHLTLGAGKVIYQHYPRISLAIQGGSFFKNENLLQAFAWAKKNQSKINFVGLVGEGNIHSSFSHLEALITMARQQEIDDFNLHLFTDGRDSPPKGVLKLLAKLPQEKIASLSGRYFAMDHDLHWERTERCYRVLTDPSRASGKFKNPEEAINYFYRRQISDEFIEPTLLQPERVIRPGDSVVFFNFREEAMKQLTEMFLNPAAGFPHSPPQNLFLVTFTRYSDKFNLPVAFPGETVTNPLGKVLADNNKVQLRIAETEKYAHVTYFFNGLREPPFANEYRVLIPSRNVARQDEFPEMMAGAVAERTIAALNEGVYDFILVNFANPDVIAHTANFDAAIQAVRAVDQQIGLLLKAALENEAYLIITADHGNIERMLDPRTGQKESKHDINPVPIYLVAKEYERQKSKAEAAAAEKINAGVLADVAPTILDLMDLPQPPEMTGISLLDILR